VAKTEKRLSEYDVYSIPLSEIYFDHDFNCRGEFSPQSTMELAESIRDRGLQFPIVVQPREDVPGLPEGYKYRVVAGHRRFVAVQRILRWDSIPALVRQGLNNEDAKVVNLVENIARQDLTLWEVSVALRNTFPRSMSCRQIARAINKSPRWVSIRLQLVDMPKKLQMAFRSGKLTARDLVYVSAKTTKEQVALIKEMVMAKDRGESSRQITQRLGLTKTRPTKTKIKEMIAHLMTAGIEADACRALLWATGGLSNEDFLSDPY